MPDKALFFKHMLRLIRYIMLTLISFSERSVDMPAIKQKPLLELISPALTNLS